MTVLMETMGAKDLGVDLRRRRGHMTIAALERVSGVRRQTIHSIEKAEAGEVSLDTLFKLGVGLATDYAGQVDAIRALGHVIGMAESQGSPTGDIFVAVIRQVAADLPDQPPEVRAEIVDHMARSVAALQRSAGIRRN